GLAGDRRPRLPPPQRPGPGGRRHRLGRGLRSRLRPGLPGRGAARSQRSRRGGGCGIVTVVNHHAPPRPGTGVLAGRVRGRRGTRVHCRTPSARAAGARAAAPWLMVAIVLIGVLTVFETVYGFWLSLTERSLGGQQAAASFIGLANYA